MRLLANGHQPCHRPATEQERSLVRWLLENSQPDLGRFLPQIDRLSLASKCNCGCPTIDFARKDGSESHKGEKLICDFLATVDSQDVGVLLFEVDGQLSSLEVYSCGGTLKPFRLPEIDSLYPWDKLEEHRRKLN